MHPSGLYTIEDLVEATGLPSDTIYDLVNNADTLGRRLGFKLGRRWFVHPEDWDAFVAARRGISGEDLPNASSVEESRRVAS